MQIVEKNVAELMPYENNPRRNEDAVSAVAASIKEFGFKVPIVIDKGNVIIAGHTRLLAAKSLGLETVPCIVADDLTEEQVRAFRLADNKVSELSSWDLGKLDEELFKIPDIDMSDFGFDASELDALLDTTGTEEHETAEGATEVETDDFDAGQFSHKCPRCGFLFDED